MFSPIQPVDSFDLNRINEALLSFDSRSSYLKKSGELLYNDYHFSDIEWIIHKERDSKIIMAIAEIQIPENSIEFTIERKVSSLSDSLYAMGSGLFKISNIDFLKSCNGMYIRRYGKGNIYQSFIDTHVMHIYTDPNQPWLIKYEIQFDYSSMYINHRSRIEKDHTIKIIMVGESNE